MSCDEVAKLRGVHVETVRAAIRRGGLPATRDDTHPRRWCVSVADAERWPVRGIGRPVGSSHVPPRHRLTEQVLARLTPEERDVLRDRSLPGESPGRALVRLADIGPIDV